MKPKVDSIRTAQALLYIVRSAGLECLSPSGENLWQVIWMNEVGDLSALQFLGRGAKKLQDLTITEFESTGGCYQNREARNVVADRAKMMFARRSPKPPRRAQGFLGLPPILDIGVYATPLHALSGVVGQGAGTEQEPAVLAVEAPQARFHFTWLTGRHNRSPAFKQLGQISRVNRRLPPLPHGFANAEMGKLAPPLIDEVDAPVGKCSPYHVWKRIDDAAGFDAHFVLPPKRDRRPFMMHSPPSNVYCALVTAAQHSTPVSS
jgi:hypothetical protein